MAVTTWNSDPDHPYAIPANAVTKYEGLVLETSYKIKRVMSDIYADIYFAVVWNPDTQAPETVETHSAFELDRRRAIVKVDATPEVRAAYKAYREAETKRFEAQEARRALENLVQNEFKRHCEPQVGQTVVVTRGRKVKKGTNGVIFWMKNGRAGVRTSDRKDTKGQWADVVWVNVAYLTNMAPFQIENVIEPGDARFAEAKAYAEILMG